jgi:hypothetical protein
MVDETFRPLVHEIFAKVNNAKDKPKKIAVLKKYDTPQLRAVLKATFDPAISWLLPEGDVPFIPNDAPEGTEHTRLEHESRQLSNFLAIDHDGKPVTWNNTLNTMKRETMFIQLLEGLCENEARLLIDIKNRVIHRKYKGLNATVVKAAFGWEDNFMPPGVSRTTKTVRQVRR